MKGLENKMYIGEITNEIDVEQITKTLCESGNYLIIGEVRGEEAVRMLEL